MQDPYSEEMFFEQQGIPPDSIADFSVVTEEQPYDIGYRIGVTVEEPSLLEPTLQEPAAIDYWGQAPRAITMPEIPAIVATTPQAPEAFPWWILALAAGVLFLSDTKKSTKT